MQNIPFKIGYIENIPVLTVLVESINASNAHWVKDELLGYVKEHHPKGLFLNLYNVKHIGHVGLGALIALNNQIKILHPHAFIGLQPEVSKLVHSSHLERVFQIWSGADNCLICGQASCGHKSELQRRMTEFLAKDHPVDESHIPHRGEPAQYKPQPPLDLTTPAQPTKKGVMTLGMAAVVGFVLIAGISAGTFMAAQNYINTPARVPMSQDEMHVRFDKNQDGLINQDDLPLLDATERLTLAATPLCKQVGLTCLSTNK